MNTDIKAAVDRFVKALRNDGAFDIVSVMVFGSQARGSAGPDSDTDVAVLLRGEQRPYLPTVFAMSDHAYDIFLDTGIDISPVPVWLHEWEDPDAYPNPLFLREIAREGIRIDAT